MTLFQSDRMFLLEKCQISHKHIFFKSRFHHNDIMTVAFRLVTHMETAMNYYGMSISEITEGEDVERVKSRLVNNARMYKQNSLVRLDDDVPLDAPDEEIINELFRLYGLHVYKIESRAYTGFICAHSFYVSVDDVSILDIGTGRPSPPPGEF